MAFSATTAILILGMFKDAFMMPATVITYLYAWFFMWRHLILPALIVVVVGGMGSIGGATLAAVIFGFVITFVTTLVDGVTAVMVSVTVMAIVLVIKPQGLMGRVVA